MSLMIAPVVAALENAGGTEIDLDSIRYNRADNTAEIRMKIYNEDYNPGQNNMYYALYYFKMNCSRRMFKPMIIEGYNKRDQLMLVNYEKREMQPITAGSNIERAYNFACQLQTIPSLSEAEKGRAK